MDYLNVDINSLAYSKLPKQDKLRVVKTKLNYLFNNKEGKMATVVYKGSKREIPYEMFGIYKDLCEREKSLEKRVNIDFQYDFEKKNDVELEIDGGKKKFEPATVNSISFDDLSIDERIKVAKAKLFYIFDLSDKYKLDHKKIIKVSYKGEEKFIPYALQGEYSKLKELIEDLEYQKRNGFDSNVISENVVPNIEDINVEQNVVPDIEDIKVEQNIVPDIEDIKVEQNIVPNIEDIKVEQNVVPDIEDIKVEQNNNDDDLSSVWSNAFKRRDINLGYKDVPKENRKRDILPDDGFSTYKNGDDDDDLSAVWENAFVLREKNRPNRGKSNLVPVEIIEDGDFDYDQYDDEKNNDNKKKKGLIGGLLAIPFVKKIVEKRKNKKDNIVNPIEKKMNRTRNLKIKAIALALAATTVIGAFIPSLIKRKSSSNVGKKIDNSSVSTDLQVPDVCEPVIEEINETNDIVEVEPIIDERDSTEEDYKVSFDDVVTINDNSYIYTNSYSACSESNSRVPLYNGSYERDILGIVYNLDGNISTIYSSDPEAYSKAEALINAGAREEAVLVNRSDLPCSDINDSEGYYNIDSVKVKVRGR